MKFYSFCASTLITYLAICVSAGSGATMEQNTESAEYGATVEQNTEEHVVERNIVVVVDLQKDYCKDCDYTDEAKPGPFHVNQPLAMAGGYASDWLRSSNYAPKQTAAENFMRNTLDENNDILLLSKDNLLGTETKCAVRRSLKQQDQGCSSQQCAADGENDESTCKACKCASDDDDCAYYKRFNYLGTPDWQKPTLYKDSVTGDLKCRLQQSWGGKASFANDPVPCPDITDTLDWLRAGAPHFTRGKDVTQKPITEDNILQKLDPLAEDLKIEIDGEKKYVLLEAYLNKVKKNYPEIEFNCDHFIYKYGAANVQEILSPNAPDGHGYLPKIQKFAQNYKGAIVYCGKVINSWLNENNGWWSNLPKVENHKLGKDFVDLENKLCNTRNSYLSSSPDDAKLEMIARYKNLQCAGASEEIVKEHNQKAQHYGLPITTSNGGLTSWCNKHLDQICHFWVLGIDFNRCVQAGAMDTMRYFNNLGSLDPSRVKITILLELTNFSEKNFKQKDQNRAADTKWCWNKNLNSNLEKTDFKFTGDGDSGSPEWARRNGGLENKDKAPLKDTDGEELPFDNRLTELALAGVEIKSVGGCMEKERIAACVNAQPNLADFSLYDGETFMDKRRNYLNAMHKRLNDMKK